MLIVWISFYTCLIPLCFNIKSFLLSITSLKPVVWGGVKSSDYQYSIFLYKASFINCNAVGWFACEHPFYIIRKLFKSNEYIFLKDSAGSLKRRLYNIFQCLEKQVLFLAVVSFVIKCYYCLVEKSFIEFVKVASIEKVWIFFYSRYSLSQVLFVCGRTNYTIRT